MMKHKPPYATYVSPDSLEYVHLIIAQNNSVQQHHTLSWTDAKAS